MNNNAPLTKSDFVGALKEIGITTKKDLQGVESRLGKKIGSVEKRLDTKIDGVEKRLDTKIGSVETNLKTAEKRLGGRIDSVETNLRSDMLSLERRLKLRMGKDRNKIMLAIGSLSTGTPTISAFRELKRKIEQPFAS